MSTLCLQPIHISDDIIPKSLVEFPQIRLLFNEQKQFIHSVSMQQLYYGLDASSLRTFKYKCASHTANSLIRPNVKFSKVIFLFSLPCFICYLIYTVSQKSPAFDLIATIFGRNVAEKVGN